MTRYVPICGHVSTAVVRAPGLPLERVPPLIAAHLREFYGPHMRLDPAVLAYRLNLKERQVVNFLSALGLRSKRHAS